MIGTHKRNHEGSAPRWLERVDPREFGVVRLAPSVRLASEIADRKSAQRAASMAHHPAGRARRRSVA